ncbi:xylose isomerase-like protein [Gloeophyllum trabeum ATCC 11539]|uniref:Xylose isomerase-like protein n=1 Tax=Gloeophyllum trabeum (strain ATCC 11539 / FP-39264 / Madison 617) TaxID=670483 RepID=S7PVP5_GLOTA|nr:xylose isomerase-like protein [Gloeophyllum trabeum ATCC 11539]EPQ51701.1 xylose isomerase-like protein [Gloeophyllum trabeum ATCC 11539]
MSTQPLSSLPLAYCTDSAGMHPAHTLPLKLQSIAGAGFPLVELAFPDLEAYAASQHPGYHKLDNAGRGDLHTLVQVARDVRGMCDGLRVKVFAVHPFSQFEGFKDPQKQEEGMLRARAWFKVLSALGCDMLQVGSSNAPADDISDSYDDMARDLRALADEAATQDPPIRIAYELWAWGTYVNTWEHTWEVCKRVDRPNFGLCLDTFQICARAFADPTAPHGLLPAPTQTLSASLSRLARTLPPSSIFYLQISDASGPQNPLFSPHQLAKDAKAQGVDARYAWSNQWRPAPWMDECVERGGWGASSFGGYLPVVDVISAVARTGWRGVCSYEVFYEPDMRKPDGEVPRRWANAAQESHKRTLSELASRGVV